MQASAPGKVLLTGGYLILDELYSGLVLGVSARLHATLYPLPSTNSNLQMNNKTNNSNNSNDIHNDNNINSTNSNIGNSINKIPKIVLFAPQMTPTPTTYSIVSPQQNTYNLKKLDGQANKFVEISVNHTLTVISGLVSPQVFHERIGNGFFLYIRGDSQFYTADKKATEEENLKDNFLPSVITTKTGLGSSAALVSAIVAVLFAQFDLLTKYNALAHHLAQFCHCSAQGKVGSGFDVAAAFYGSQRYTRFSPQLIESLLQTATQTPLSSTQLLVTLQTSSPFIKHIPFSLPPGLHLLLGDVQGGSETPGMVKKVLEWRKKDEKVAKDLWDSLAHLNFEVESELRVLGEQAAKDPAGYQASLRVAYDTVPTHWGAVFPPAKLSTMPTLQSLIKLQHSFLRVRSLLTHMGKVAGTEIEPETQSKLLNLTMNIPGVVFAGVPGAGGYDAIFAVAVRPQDVPLSDLSSRVEDTWSKYNVKRLRLDADTKETAGLRVGVKSEPPPFVTSLISKL